MVAEFPAEPDYRYDLAGSSINLGGILKRTGRPKQAEEAYRDAITVQRQLVTEFPAVHAYHEELAVSYYNLGTLLWETGHIKEAEGACHEALAIQKRLANEFPAVPHHRWQLARSHFNLGNLFKKTSRPKEAEGAYREALAIQKQLAAEFPAEPDFRRDLAMIDNNLGNLLKAAGRPKEAEVLYRDAVILRERLAMDFPDIPDYHNELARTLCNLAALLRDREDFHEARDLLEVSEPHHQAALKAHPDNSTYREVLQNARIIRATIFAGLGDHGGAEQTAEELAALGWDSAADTYNGACALAQCIPVVEKNAQLTEPKREELARSYADRALAMLRQAVRKGYKNAAHMKKDTDLDPLLAHPEFQKLLKELE